MKADTKSNLAWRVDCEFGATQGKVDLASCAKRNNLDAIHDTVHEMAQRRGASRQGSEGPVGALLRLIHGNNRNLIGLFTKEEDHRKAGGLLYVRM